MSRGRNLSDDFRVAVSFIVEFTLKLFNSVNIDFINYCRWYFDSKLPSKVLAKRMPNLRGNLQPIKICIVILVCMQSGFT